MGISLVRSILPAEGLNQHTGTKHHHLWGWQWSPCELEWLLPGISIFRYTHYQVQEFCKKILLTFLQLLIFTANSSLFHSSSGHYNGWVYLQSFLNHVGFPGSYLEPYRCVVNFCLLKNLATRKEKLSLIPLDVMPHWMILIKRERVRISLRTVREG